MKPLLSLILLLVAGCTVRHDHRSKTDGLLRPRVTVDVHPNIHIDRRRTPRRVRPCPDGVCPYKANGCDCERCDCEDCDCGGKPTVDRPRYIPLIPYTPWPSPYRERGGQ